MDSPLACNLAALDAAAREVRERPDGYAFRYPADALLVAAEFVALERRCCPFFCFALALEPDDGPLWLSITGPEGTKAFLLAELGDEMGLADAS